MNKIEEKATQIIDVSISVTLKKEWLGKSKKLEIVSIIVLDTQIDIPTSIKLEYVTEEKCIVIASRGKVYFLTMDYHNIVYYSVEEDGLKSLYKIIGIDKIKTRLETEMKDKFISFKELIKDVLTEITDDRLYEMIWEKKHIYY
jgi:hypothetical protein